MIKLQNKEKVAKMKDSLRIGPPAIGPSETEDCMNWRE
jgi:hypothetical protein